MPRRPNIDPPVKLTLHLPQSVHTRLSLYLYSELEGRVPYGAFNKFFTERTNEFFEKEQHGAESRDPE